MSGYQATSTYKGIHPWQQWTSLFWHAKFYETKLCGIRDTCEQIPEKGQSCVNLWIQCYFLLKS